MHTRLLIEVPQEVQLTSAMQREILAHGHVSRTRECTLSSRLIASKLTVMSTKPMSMVVVYN